MAEVFVSKLQLAVEKGRRSGVAGGEPWTAESRGEPRGPIESAVQSGTAAGCYRITIPDGTSIGLDGRIHIEPMRWMGNVSVPSPARSQASTSSRNGNSGSVLVQKINGKNQVKQNKDIPLFDGTKAKLHSIFGIFIDGVDVPVAAKTMSVAALQEAFPRENVQSI